MSYRRPGVYVTQEYLATSRPTLKLDSYLPAIFGTSAYVVEGEDAYFGVRSLNETGPSVYTLSKPADYSIDPSELRVFLSPAGMFAEPVRYFSRNLYSEYSVPFPRSTTAIDITEWLKTKTVVINNVTVNCFDAANGIIYLPDSIAFTEQEIASLKIYGNVTFDPVPNSTSLFVPKNFDFVRVFVEYIARPSASNSLIGYPQKITSVAQIEQLFGRIHPLNPVAFASYLAMSASGSRMPIIAVMVPGSSLNPSEPDPIVLADIMKRVAINPAVYTLVPLGDASTSSYIQATINAIAEAYSENYMRQFRIAMLGFKSFKTAFGSNLNDKEAVKRNLANIISPLEEKRVRIVLNPVLQYYFNGFNYPIPGYYYAAIYAGQVGAMMNNLIGRPSDILTETVVPGVSDVLWPNFLRYYFSEQDLNEIASMGYWILYKDELDNVKVRHQITTANMDQATMEDSIIRTVDFVSNDLKSLLKNFVARILLTEQTLRNDIIPAITNRIQYYIGLGIVGPQTRLVEAFIPEDALDSVVVNIRVQVVFPLNYVDLRVTAGANV